MRQFIDVTGKTEDEAIQNALRQLGLDRDDVSVELLARAESGFLGLGSCPDKVRGIYGTGEETEAPAPGEASKEIAVLTRVGYGTEEEGEAPAPAEAEEQREEPVRPKPAKAEKKPRQERKPEEKPAAPAVEAEEAAPEKAPEAAPAQTLGEEVDDEKAQAIRKFLSGLLEQMESTAEIHIYIMERGS